MCKEIFAWNLASQFDLFCPDVAVIRVDKALAEEIKFKINKELNPGFYFGSHFEDNTFMYADQYKLGLDDVVRIFGFDFVIRNVDRRISKPNLLIRNQEPVVIDHELSLEVNKTFDRYIEAGEVDFLRKQTNDRHIFLHLLQAMNNKAPHPDFSILVEYCRTLNVNPLFSLADDLLELGIEEAGVVTPIADYLESVRRNYQKIPQLCRQLTQ